MIRLDMSEYQLRESVNRLIGSRTTGEGGRLMGQGGVLTEAVRKNPFSLVLLDEIEKAHPDILNLFLQVMDDGRLTDTLGRTVDFSQTIIIATSNAGTQFLQDSLRQGKPLEEIKNQLMLEELKKTFRPEFLNRFDGVVVFKPLSQEHINTIAGIAVALTEASTARFKKYGQQIVKNAKALAQTLMINGVNLTTGGTDNHLMVADLR